MGHLVRWNIGLSLGSFGSVVTILTSLFNYVWDICRSSRCCWFWFRWCRLWRSFIHVTDLSKWHRERQTCGLTVKEKERSLNVPSTNTLLSKVAPKPDPTLDIPRPEMDAEDLMGKTKELLSKGTGKKLRNSN